MLGIGIDVVISESRSHGIVRIDCDAMRCCRIVDQACVGALLDAGAFVARLLPRADTAVRCINEGAAQMIRISRGRDTIMRQVSEGRRVQRKGLGVGWATLCCGSGEAAADSLQPALILASALGPDPPGTSNAAINAQFTLPNATINNNTIRGI